MDSDKAGIGDHIQRVRRESCVACVCVVKHNAGGNQYGHVVDRRPHPKHVHRAGSGGSAQRLQSKKRGVPEFLCKANRTHKEKKGNNSRLAGGHSTNVLRSFWCFTNHTFSLLAPGVCCRLALLKLERAKFINQMEDSQETRASCQRYSHNAHGHNRNFRHWQNRDIVKVCMAAIQLASTLQMVGSCAIIPSANILRALPGHDFDIDFSCHPTASPYHPQSGVAASALHSRGMAFDIRSAPPSTRFPHPVRKTESFSSTDSSEPPFFAEPPADALRLYRRSRVAARFRRPPKLSRSIEIN